MESLIDHSLLLAAWQIRSQQSEETQGHLMSWHREYWKALDHDEPLLGCGGTAMLMPKLRVCVVCERESKCAYVKEREGEEKKKREREREREREKWECGRRI